MGVFNQSKATINILRSRRGFVIKYPLNALRSHYFDLFVNLSDGGMIKIVDSWSKSGYDYIHLEVNERFTLASFFHFLMGTDFLSFFIASQNVRP